MFYLDTTTSWWHSVQETSKQLKERMKLDVFVGFEITKDRSHLCLL